MEGQIILALGIVIAAVAEDLWRREISNWTCLAAFVGGVWLHLYERGPYGIGSVFLSALAGFCVFLAFYLLGGMGGGDVKLMAGFGAVLGKPGVLLEAALLTGFIGGVMALLVLVFRGLGRLIRTPKVHDEAVAERRAHIPYAPAITLGVWLSLLGNL